MSAGDDLGLAGAGGFGYADAQAFLISEWRRVWDVKSSLEQRAITLITTSGVLVTLAFGFATVASKGETFANFTRPERVVLVISLSLFACSAFIALVVNLPKGYSTPDFTALLGLKLDPQAEPAARGDEPADMQPIDRLAAAISKAKALNNAKAFTLTYAFMAQFAAIFMLVVVVAMVTA